MFIQHFSSALIMIGVYDGFDEGFDVFPEISPMLQWYLPRIVGCTIDYD